MYVSTQGRGPHPRDAVYQGLRASSRAVKLWVVLALGAGALIAPFPTATADASPDAYLEQLQAEADARGLHHSRMWKLLGHYRPNALDGVTSDVDGPNFFLSEHGRHDPRAELLATLAGFGSVEADTSAQCRFRARYEWLRDTLDIDPARLPPADCPDWDRWRSALGARSVTLVFASAFLNNPASMFGHTFLRLDRDRRGEGADLLAYVVNFAADPTTHNELLYVFHGATGGFAGRFNTIPYYLKVKEYTDIDSRDLWEYELALGPAEVHRLLAHLWEVGPHAIDYFYFDENCSYQLLSVLEVARPSLRLTDGFPDVVIPPDTVRAVVQSRGLVRARAWRPSNRRSLVARRSRLSTTEAQTAKRLADAADALTDGTDARADQAGALAELETLPTIRQALTLDAAIALHRYRADTDGAAWGRELLLRRGRLGVATRAPEVHEPAAPDAGHRSHALGLFAGVDTRGSLAQISLRPALHEIVSPQAGYAENTELSFLTTTVSVGESGTQLEEFDALRIQSLLPLDAWDPALSWRFRLGAARLREDGCRGARCLYGSTGGGPGVAVGWGDQVVFGFLEAEVGYGPAWRGDVQAALAPGAGLILQLGSSLRVLWEAGLTYDLDGGGLPTSLVPGDLHGPRLYVDGALGIRLATDVELRATGTVRRGFRTGLLGILLHR